MLSLGSLSFQETAIQNPSFSLFFVSPFLSAFLTTDCKQPVVQAITKHLERMFKMLQAFVQFYRRNQGAWGWKVTENIQCAKSNLLDSMMLLWYQRYTPEWWTSLSSKTNDSCLISIIEVETADPEVRNQLSTNYMRGKSETYDIGLWEPDNHQDSIQIKIIMPTNKRVC